jgi:hypothetical protein
MRFFRYKLLDLHCACALLVLGGAIVATALAPVVADEVYGPTNMLKTLHNPFMGAQGSEGTDSTSFTAIDSPISIDDISGESPATTVARSLFERFTAPLLYLPGRMTMGKPTEFVVKGKPDYYVALAMADRDSGAKALYGHAIHLGPDRKVMSVGKIPKDGLLHLWIEAPFEGDLVGLPLYFDAAVWAQPDFSDLQIATPVRSELEGTPQAAGNFKNGVIMAASADMVKKDPVIVHETPETTIQHMQYTGPRLDSGHP